VFMRLGLALKDQGHEVVGVFMRLGSPGETIDELQPFDSAGVSCDPAKVKIGHQGCCSINDAADARLVAAHLGIPLYVCNFKKDFGRIIDYFVDEYAERADAQPVRALQRLAQVRQAARVRRADRRRRVASGHYARVDHGDGAGRSPRGVDHGKDQSYVLFGDAVAEAGRDAPADRRVHQARDPRDRRASGACRSSTSPTARRSASSRTTTTRASSSAAGPTSPDARGAGEIRDTAGNVLGEHEGQHRFTIGQRRGVGVALGHPIYVVDKDPRTNTVTVGGREDLALAGLIAREANWLVDAIGSRRQAWRRRPRAVPLQQRTRARPRAHARRHDEPTPSGRPGRFEVGVRRARRGGRAGAGGGRVRRLGSRIACWAAGGSSGPSAEMRLQRESMQRTERMTDEQAPRMTTPDDHPRPIAIYLVGYNAESLDRQDDPTADDDGHVISASVMRREDTQSPISPVNVRISHGASPATIASMLRKMAEMVEPARDRQRAARDRGPAHAGRDGATKRVTIEQFEQAAEHLPEDQRDQLLSIMDRLRRAIADEER
jgi:tRNA-specific 2-thiouridylase